MVTLLQDLRAGSAIDDADLFHSSQAGRSVSQTASAIRAYLASERRIAFNEDGIFRRYKELDR